MGVGVQQGEAYLGFAALQPVVKEGVIGTADVGGKGVLPDCGVWGLVQVGQVLEGALAEALQGCGNRAVSGEWPRTSYLVCVLFLPNHDHPRAPARLGFLDYTGQALSPQVHVQALRTGPFWK